eukprot:NODE_553_length_6120_cov_0.628135.p1 type:complete len:276 gc:universal NODE_553_length_6120_cov_0.628135:4060-4887(+)
MIVFTLLIFGYVLTDTKLIYKAIGPARIAAATYCLSRSAKNWNCKRHCQAKETLGTEIVDIFDNNFTGTYGFVTVNHISKLITFAFRGTMTPQNLILDAKFYLKSIKKEMNIPDNKAAVHSGFLDSYLSIQKDVMAAYDKLNKLYPTYLLHFSGHSLGSVVAQLAALEISYKYQNHEQIEQFSFNSPRVGNMEYVNLIKFKIYRFTQGPDLISRLPFRFLNYRHPKTEEHWETKNGFYTCSDFESSECNNSIALPYFDLINVHLKSGTVHFGPWC